MRLRAISEQSSTNRKILRAREYIWALLACGVDGESYGHHADVRIVSRPVRIETFVHLPLKQSSRQEFPHPSVSASTSSSTPAGIFGGEVEG
jgi:hypothetical protein